MTTRFHIIRDLTVVAAGIVLAVLFLTTDVLVRIIDASRVIGWFGSFVAGLFFTSAFTTAPAIVALGGIAQQGSVFFTALFGALGAVIGDMVMYRFFSDDLSVHINELLGYQKGYRRVRHLFRLKSMRWFTFMVGGLIIASPLPDELGVGILSLARFRIHYFVPISFTFNFIGIYVIGSVAKTLL